jgi:hypothetical protein
MSQRQRSQRVRVVTSAARPALAARLSEERT